ncbi:MAG: hypothetical protein IKR43_04130 [Lachnospiraceae bacterium]|nr:hypothetical protein [Lachnospiraceae bacterium]
MKRKTQLNVILLLTVLVLSFCFFMPRGEASTSYSISLSEIRTQIHDGTEGKTYYGRLYMANGQAPFTASVTSGSLPPGLALHNQGDEFFDLSGTPTETGIFTFTITIRDANNMTGSWTYTVRIADRYNIFRVTVKNGEAQNIYGHAATSFQAGEAVALSWKGYAAPGHCLEKWVYPASVDPDESMFFYMPAENVNVEAVFTEIVKGSSHYADVTPNGGPYGYSETEENTLQAAADAELIGRKVEYISRTYPWYYEFVQNRYYDLDKDGHYDLQLIRVENSLGQVTLYGGPAAETNLADHYSIGLTDEIINAMDRPVYEAIEFFLGHKLKPVGFSYPTCTSEGVKAHYVCTGCGKLFWDAKGKEPVGDPSEVVLEANGHVMTHVGGLKPTCTEAGVVEHYSCDECHKLFYDQAGLNPVADEKDLHLPAYGHDLTHVTGLKPTCTEDGVVEHYECSICHQWF